MDEPATPPPSSPEPQTPSPPGMGEPTTPTLTPPEGPPNLPATPFNPPVHLPRPPGTSRILPESVYERGRGLFEADPHRQPFHPPPESPPPLPEPLDGSPELHEHGPHHEDQYDSEREWQEMLPDSPEMREHSPCYEHQRDSEGESLQGELPASPDPTTDEPRSPPEETAAVSSPESICEKMRRLEQESRERERGNAHLVESLRNSPERVGNECHSPTQAA